MFLTFVFLSLKSINLFLKRIKKKNMCNSTIR